MARLLDRLVGHRGLLESLFDAQEGARLASTLLFTGTHGIGKKLAALTLAQALVCERRVRGACGECGACVRLEKGQSESLLVVEPEGAALKIEQARQILEYITLRKLGQARIIILDQAHLLNPQAGNTLLKSLEEPPDGTYFILVTSIPAAVLSTIRSRAQLVRFKPLRTEDLVQVLKQGREPGYKPDDWILRSAHGSVERARQLEEKREDFQKIEAAALSYFAVAPERLPGLEIGQLRELMKDKSAQSFVAGFFQSVMLDGLRVQGGLSGTSEKHRSSTVQIVSRFAPKALQRLADLSIGFEHEMARNVDRGLLLENFAIQIRMAATQMAGQ